MLSSHQSVRNLTKCLKGISWQCEIIWVVTYIEQSQTHMCSVNRHLRRERVASHVARAPRESAEVLTPKIKLTLGISWQPITKQKVLKSQKKPRKTP